LLLIALAALWLGLLAFVVTMCRAAARSDEARAPARAHPPQSRTHPRTVTEPRKSAGASRPIRSSMRVE
jgi:hypothetical protein